MYHSTKGSMTMDQRKPVVQQATMFFPMLMMRCLSCTWQMVRLRPGNGTL